jgi:hypothetical protein
MPVDMIQRMFAQLPDGGLLRPNHVPLAGFFCDDELFCAAGITWERPSRPCVRQKVNVVTLAPSLTAEARPAGQGTVIHDENVVDRDGISRRAEFADLTLARRPNSIFTFDAKARAMDFTCGAVLFSPPTNSGAIQLRSGAISGAITGSTGLSPRSRSKELAKQVTRSHGKRTTTVVGMLRGRSRGITLDR